jgi:Skp family chaperone for outer membrane proteins
VFSIAAAAVIAGSALCSCSSDAAKQGKKTADNAISAEGVTNIRFYNLDSVSKNYKLIEKLNAEADAAMAEYQAEERRKSNELQRIGAQIQDKVRNNGYLSEASYNADVQDFQNKQTQAQNYLAGLQEKLAKKAADQQQMLLDSINNFLEAYNAKLDRPFDAIFIMTPGQYVNPDLDITDDIVEGLNARYVEKATKADKDEKAETAKK